MNNQSANPKTEIVTHLRNAGESMQSAWATAVKANPMASDLPAFQKLKDMEKELARLMMEVTKVRGLD